jgi:hypothetical protein
VGAAFEEGLDALLLGLAASITTTSSPATEATPRRRA